jgi:hypothetical protein
MNAKEKISVTDFDYIDFVLFYMQASRYFLQQDSILNIKSK